MPRCLSVLLIALFLFGSKAMAQSQSDSLTIAARYLFEEKKYPEAAAAFQAAFQRDASLYNEYFETLLLAKNYPEANALLDRQQTNPRVQFPVLLLLDAGRIQAAQGKEKKAEEYYEKAIAAINGDDLLTSQMAGAFVRAGRTDYAIRVYEQATLLLRNPYLYAGQLARLYAQSGDIQKAASTILEAAPGQPNGLDDSKAALLELLGNDPAKLQIAQKAIIKKINLAPDNPFFTELLTWLFTLKDDWAGALVQIQALDTRNGEEGRRLIEFAQTAAREEHYDIAIQALDAVIAKGPDKPLYAAAQAQKLETAFDRMEANPRWTQAEATALEKEYEAFYIAHPELVATQTTRDYAAIMATFTGKPRQAITVLRKAIDEPGANRQFVGGAKLQMGDYQALAGDVWEASLTYSQVDKTFREDALGEEARYRNARLAYYRGDFEWAQGQLNVLKASTSELIANDALYLSVLITENTPDTADSSVVPLRRFAYADMLLYQNKDAEAETLLDSVTRAYPKHQLADDILMLRARLAQKHREYPRALGYLAAIHKDFGKDVLGDDALYQSAVINQKFLSNAAEARRLYEQIIMDYPGSTYVQSARNELTKMKEPVAP